MQAVLSSALASVALSALFVPASPAQNVGGEWTGVFAVPGEAPGERAGSAVAGAGDVDGDGTPDLIVGVPDADPSGLTDAGSARVYSGASGALLWRFDGAAAGERLGAAVDGLGDVDGDGFADLLYGVPGRNGDTGAAVVRSGATGLVLWQFTGLQAGDFFASSVADAGDVDADGVPDVLVGAPAQAQGGSIWCYSGATGAVLWQFDGPGNEFLSAGAVASAGDIDADGHADLLMGSGDYDRGAGTNSGSAFVHAGSDGALLLILDGVQAQARFGDAVSELGDVNGDGFDDFLVGAPLFDGVGAVTIRSGVDGSVLRQIDGPALGSEFGAAVSTAGDVDDDGVPDVIVGAPGAAPGGLSAAGAVFVHSGATGAELARFVGTAADEERGAAVADAGDVDGNGCGDVLFGIPGFMSGGATEAGRAEAWSFDPFFFADARTLSAAGGTVALDVVFPSAEAGAAYGILVSAAGTGPTTLLGIQVPLARDRWFRLGLTGWTPPGSSGFDGTLDASGNASASLTATSSLSSVVGTTFWLAAVSYDAATTTGRRASIARPITIVP